MRSTGFDYKEKQEKVKNNESNFLNYMATEGNEKQE